MERLKLLTERMNATYLDGELLYLQCRALQNMYTRLKNEAAGFVRDNRGSFNLDFDIAEADTIVEKL